MYIKIIGIYKLYSYINFSEFRVCSVHKNIQMKQVYKKERTKNFTESEKMLLIKLVQERYKILENKTTNSVCVKEKEDCWKNLRINFMSRSKKIIRTVHSLKTCWENIKKGPRNNMLRRNRQFIKQVDIFNFSVNIFGVYI